MNQSCKRATPREKTRNLFRTETRSRADDLSHQHEDLSWTWLSRKNQKCSAKPLGVPREAHTEPPLPPGTREENSWWDWVMGEAQELEGGRRQGRRVLRRLQKVGHYQSQEHWFHKIVLVVQGQLHCHGQGSQLIISSHGSCPYNLKLLEFVSKVPWKV